MHGIYTFTMDVCVFGIDALFNAALRHAIDVDNLTASQACELLKPDGDIDVEACLVMLLDPGSLPGCQIIESEAAQ